MDSLSAFRNTNAGDDVPEAFELSHGVGLTSLGIGLAQLLAPNLVGAITGVAPGLRRTVGVRATGVGDVALGLGVLLRPRRPGPLWARVAADALGLGLLAWSIRGKRSGRDRAI